MVTRVAHLSTAHGRNELRVHLKECNSLAKAGYEVHYIVADGLGSKLCEDIFIHDIGKARNRLIRMLISPWIMLMAARRINAKIYHFHDPELLLIGLFLLVGGAKVIYDSHEDTPRALLNREWIPGWIKYSFSTIFEKFENFVSHRLSAVVTATPFIEERFARINSITKLIQNYPLPNEIESCVYPKISRRNFCYLGGVSKPRGILEMVKAFENVDAKLIIAGKFENEITKKNVCHIPGWRKVDYRGLVTRTVAWEIMLTSIAGVVLYHPEENHVKAQPNKLYEYMTASLPIIASNFPLWREIVEGNLCGICVDPLNPKAIGDAMQYLVDNPQEAEQMGKNGRKAVEQKYNWSIEEKKLLKLYKDLLQ
jgi:glycosyltransferase involved in cell wall biosynthesis